MTEWNLKEMHVTEISDTQGVYSIFIVNDFRSETMKIVINETESERDQLAYLFDTIQQAETV